MGMYQPQHLGEHILSKMGLPKNWKATRVFTENCTGKYEYFYDLNQNGKYDAHSEPYIRAFAYNPDDSETDFADDLGFRDYHISLDGHTVSNSFNTTSDYRNDFFFTSGDKDSEFFGSSFEPDRLHKIEIQEGKLNWPESPDEPPQSNVSEQDLANYLKGSPKK